jgi:hypothetical protein
MMFNGRVLAVLASALIALRGGTEPWDKPPEQWDLADSYKILRDSPWTPSETKFEANFTQRHTDKLTGLAIDSPTNATDTPVIRGVEVNRNKPLPPLSVLWWSSRTIRLAERRILELKNSRNAPRPAQIETLPDYVIAIEGSEPMRIFQDATEDLHEMVFVVLDEGLTLDLAQAKFVEATDDTDARVEFHFPREIEGHPAVDPQSEKIEFHCKASAKTPRPGRQNAIAIRSQFHPRLMRANGAPDL